MRKILATVFATVVLMTMFTTTAFADEYVDTQENPSYETQTEVYYHAYSTYTVSVPVCMEEGQVYDITADVSNIENGYTLEAYVTNMDENGEIPLEFINYERPEATGKIQVITSEYNTIDYNTGWIGTFFDAQGGSMATVGVGYNVSEAPTVAGDYKAVICFRFDCQMIPPEMFY